MVARIYTKNPAPKRPMQTPFTLARSQFPIIPFFAISMDKARVLLRFGIYLPRRVFPHGQLYAALSRSKKKSYIRAILFFTDGRPPARNVVYKELLC